MREIYIKGELPAECSETECFAELNSERLLCSCRADKSLGVFTGDNCLEQMHEKCPLHSLDSLEKHDAHNFAIFLGKTI